jgi:hypothetical protein
MKNGKRNRKRQKLSRPSRTSRAPGTSAEAASPARSSESAEATEGSAGWTPVKPWWERYPQRLQFELQQLDEAGIKYQVDLAAKKRGVLVIDLEIDWRGTTVALQARFSDYYPYFRFEITAPKLDLPYHQHPFGKQLCVLGRATVHWNTTDTLASFIKERVPQVLNTSHMQSADEAVDLEERQGEPYSDYYPYADNSMLLVDSSWNLDGADSGQLIVGFPIGRQQATELRGAVLEIRGTHGQLIAEADYGIKSIFPRRFQGRWIKVTEAVQAVSLDFFHELYRQEPQLEKPKWQLLDRFRFDLIGVVFPEEHHWRSDKSDGWVFAARTIPVGGTGEGPTHFLVRAGRAGASDLVQRVPELAGLRSRKVVVVGAGALGAPSCFEFARCGVGELRILDFDFVDPGTISRWPLGLSAAGLLKVKAIHRYIALNYPYTTVVPFKHRLGTCRDQQSTRSEITIVDELIDGADLIYDASAETGINHLLSDVAREREVPYIGVSTTYGAWGGRLIRIRPRGVTAGCWMCQSWAVERGEIPSPPSDPRGEVQPAGCADPTFTGSGFEVTQIALAGVRLCVGTLSSSPADYPDVDWDVAILRFRDEHGLVTVPRYDVFPLEIQPDCQNHNADSRQSVDSARSFKAAR